MENDKVIKKALRITARTLLLLAVLLLALWLALGLGPVQTWLAHKATTYLSNELGTNVYIEKLRVRLPLSVEAINFGIDGLEGKPLLHTQRLELSLHKLSLKKRFFHLGRILLENPEINLLKLKGNDNFNFQFLVDYFGPGDTIATESRPWRFDLASLTISNACFAMQDFNREPASYGIDVNHLRLQNMNLTANNISSSGDTLLAYIHHLSAVEHSGFNLRRLTADLVFCPTSIELNNSILQTDHSDLLLDFGMHFSSLKAFSHFTDSVYLQATIHPSELNLNDISWFVPEMRGMDNLFTLEGNLSGEIKSLRAKNLRFTYGRSTRFVGNLTLDGLPGLAETFIHLDIKELTTQSRDLTTFRLPSSNGPTYLSLSEEFYQLGVIRVKAIFTGFYTDFVSYGTFTSNMGKVNTDIALRYDFETDELQYKGSLATKAFNLGKLLADTENFGTLNLTADVVGTGRFPSNFDLQFNAVVDSLEFRRNSYDRITMKGELKDKKFDGQLSINDELIQFGFQGLFDLNQDPPVFDFSALLVDARLSTMNLINRDLSSTLSSSLTINFSGSNLDELQGKIIINDTRYSEAGKVYNLKNLVLEANPDSLLQKTLTLRSDYADADIKGVFDYAKLWPALKKMMHQYLPSLALSLDQNDIAIPNQSFNAIIRLKETDIFSELFFPDIFIEEGALVEADFDTKIESIILKANSPSLKIQGIKFKNLNISILAQDRNLKLRTTLSHIYIKEPTKSDSLKVSLEKVLLTGEFSGDTIQYKFSWADHFNPKLNSGRVDGFLTFVNIPQVEFRITQSELMIGGDPWAFNHNNSVLFDTDTITIRNLALAGSNQKIKIEGKISPNPTDDLLATFEAFSISSLDPILYYYGIDVKGILSGSIGVNNVYDNPGLSANLVLNKTIFNSEPLGDLFVNATWNSTSESIWVNTHITYTGNIGTIVPLSLTGNYFPNKANNNLDFLLKVNNFKLQTLEPYVEGLFSNIQGLATGELAIKGPVSEPIVEGDLRLMRAEFRFDYTNISYSLADLIHFEKDRIYGNNIQVFDNFGNSGLCDVQVLHKNFDDFRLEVKITASNLAGLETDASQNSLFYGTAYVSGTVVVFGPLDDITIDLKLKSEPRTSITIPISYAVDVADNTFIIFNNPSGTLDTPIRKIESSSAVRMNMDLDVTRDADIQLFLPYQMGNIQSTGNGKIKMHYNTNGDFTMYGDYFMHQGTFLFTLKNFINRPFVLQKGGVIRWSGSPYDAEIDLSAIYKLKVNLNGLPNISEEFSNRRFPVDCVLKLKNNLMDPDITFSLRMPNVDQNVQREVFSVIDTTNQVMLSRQVISLLLLGNFNFSVEQGNFATSLETSSFDLISSQLSNWISQISKDFDFGLNYRPEDELTPEELELALSTQLFDDRVLIDGNFLVGNRENQNASNVIGDINVEFLLTRDGRFRVRAFNKYNELDITRQETPYTQGVAFFYRREFNGINDLFRRRRKTPVEGEVVNNNKDGSLFLLPTNTELY